MEDYAANGGDPAPVQRLCRLEPAAPWSILAITFTNKAAGELKERLTQRLGPMANDVWASTFHSACVRVLRRDIDRRASPRTSPSMTPMQPTLPHRSAR